MKIIVLIFSLFWSVGLYAQTHQATYTANSWTDMNTGQEKTEPVKITFSDKNVAVELGGKKWEGKLTSRTDGDKKIEFAVELNGKATAVKVLTFGKPSVSIKNDELNALINCE